MPELGEFLSKVNSPPSPLETAKCDVWPSTEINPEEEIFGATHKFGSYVDLLFSDEAKRFSFPEHEQLAKRLTQLLQRAPEIAAAAELLIRRCYYTDEEGIRDGFYITFYLFGYGDDETQSRQRWAIGLKLVQNAIRQLSADLSLAGLRGSLKPRPRFSTPPFEPGAQHGQQHHRKKNCQQSKGCRANVDRSLRQNGKPSVHELNMHPINHQGSLPKLDQRAETPLARSPSAPQIRRSQNHQQ